MSNGDGAAGSNEEGNRGKVEQLDQAEIFLLDNM